MISVAVMHISFGLCCAFKIEGLYFNISILQYSVLESVFRLNVWLHEGPGPAFSISDSFFLTGTHWLWTGTRDFSQDDSQDSP